MFAPRIGVLFASSPKFGVWLRGGLTRASLSATTPGSDPSDLATTSSTSALAISLDPQLVISPVPHVALTLSANCDIGVSGSTETQKGGITVSNDSTASSYGVTFGTALLL